MRVYYQVNYMLINGFTTKMKSQSIAYLLNGSEHIYIYIYIGFWTYKSEVHSIWVIWTSNLQECKGQARVEGIGQGWGPEALTFLMVPLLAVLTSATLVGGI
jgi:hypothetical protein